MAGSLRQISQHKRERLTTKVLPPSYGSSLQDRLVFLGGLALAAGVAWTRNRWGGDSGGRQRRKAPSSDALCYVCSFLLRS